MVKYMVSLPGVGDPKMDDGTTAFAIALAKGDLHLIRVLLASKLQSDIEHRGLATRAILELEEDHEISELGQKYIDGLKYHLMSSFGWNSSQEELRSKVEISKE